jgi:RNA polymerase primary sigma factor
MLLRIQGGDKAAMQDLVCANLRFVVSVALNYQHQGIPLPELINEGNLGLIEGARRYSLTSKVRFISYAVWWIRQSIVRAMFEKARLIRVSAEKEAKLKKMNRLLDRHIQDHHGHVERRDLARTLHTDIDDVDRIMAMDQDFVRLSDTLRDSEDRTFLEIIPDAGAEGPSDNLIRESLKGSLNEMLSAISLQEREILEMYYGLRQDLSYNLEEIGNRLHLSKERVRQIKKQALDKMKNQIASHQMELEEVA